MSLVMDKVGDDHANDGVLLKPEGASCLVTPGRKLSHVNPIID